MPALYFFRRDNDNDDDNRQKALSANDDDYNSYEQISVIVLKKYQGVQSKLPTVILRFVRFYEEFSIPVCYMRDFW